MMEKRIVEYGICSAEDHFQLAHLVNDAIGKGWEPLNTPLFSSQFGSQTLIHREMVRYGLINKQVKKKQQ